MSNGDAEVGTWRIPRNLRLASWVPVLIVAALTADLMVRPSPAFPTGASALDALVFMVFTFPVFVPLLVAHLSVLSLDEHGITVRTFRSKTIPWADIKDAQPGYWGMAISRRSGRTILSAVGGKSNWSVWRKHRTWADELADTIRLTARNAEDRP